MDKKEIEGAKQLIEIPDVKKGSYGFIGDSTITYADIRILLDYIKDLEQENQKYKEVIDKIDNFVRKYMDEWSMNGDVWHQLNEILILIEEVK